MCENEIVKWLTNSSEDEPYKMTTWYRCAHIQEFVERVEKEDDIVGIVFSDNNIGFILKEKNV